MTIHEQENILLEEWWNSYPANERETGIGGLSQPNSLR